MIALDQWTSSDMPTLYGAVTLGSVWQFLVLQRAERRILQDTRTFTISDSLGDLLRVLVGILEGVPFDGGKGAGNKS